MSTLDAEYEEDGSYEGSGTDDSEDDETFVGDGKDELPVDEPEVALGGGGRGARFRTVSKQKKKEKKRKRNAAPEAGAPTQKLAAHVEDEAKKNEMDDLFASMIAESAPAPKPKKKKAVDGTATKKDGAAKKSSSGSGWGYARQSPTKLYDFLRFFPPFCN